MIRLHYVPMVWNYKTMQNPVSPLDPLLKEVNIAANNGLPFLAIAMTVSLPDVCASLLADDGRTNSKLYKQWCATNLSSEYFSFVTPDDLYSMRCGVLHNGRFGELTHSVARVIFVPPTPSGHTIVNCRANDAYIYSLVDFCKAFTDSVYRWFESNKENEVLKKNLPKLMQYRTGFSPYIAGITVLA